MGNKINNYENQGTIKIKRLPYAGLLKGKRRNNDVIVVHLQGTVPNSVNLRKPRNVSRLNRGCTEYTRLFVPRYGLPSNVYLTTLLPELGKFAVQLFAFMSGP